MPIEDYQNLTDADFVGLPALVKEGEVRSERLQEVIDGWVDASSVLIGKSITSRIDLKIIEAHPSVLKRIDLRDDSTPDADPIDLGRDLLIPLAKRLQQNMPPKKAEEEEAEKKIPILCAIFLLGCQVDSISAQGVTLLGSLNLYGCHVKGKSDFSGARFGDSTYFRGATFGGSANFRGATFGDSANFGEATFGGLAYFREATFLSKCEFYGADFRKANLSHGYLPLEQEREWKYSWHKMKSLPKSIYSMPRELFQRMRRAKKNFLVWPFMNKERHWLDCLGIRALIRLKRHLLKHIDWKSLGDIIEWRWVRSLGELTLLTRVSYFSLAGVPLLAGLWGPLRTWILQMNEGLDESINAFEKEVNLINWQDSLSAESVQLFLDKLQSSTLDESMPTGWIMAFSVALSVVIAQFIYQIRAPELVKEQKEKDLVEESNELIRREEEISNNWLRESVGYLEDAWQRMPHRHNAWFVVRGLRTVWIPDNVEEHYEDAKNEEERPDDAPDDWVPKQLIAQQEVRGEDRKRIAIEEGQKARYAIEVFTNRKAAWLSGGFYIVGGFLTAMIIIRQLSYVLAASEANGWAKYPETLSNGWFAFYGTLVLIFLTLTGSYLVKEPTKPDAKS